MTNSKENLTWQKGPITTEEEKSPTARVRNVNPRVIVKLKDLSPARDNGFSASDLFSQESVDYPDFASKTNFKQHFDSELLNNLKRRFKDSKGIDPSTKRPPRLELWNDAIVEDRKQGHELAHELRKLDVVKTAYLHPGPVEPPMVNAANDPLSTLQTYLDPAPAGIDARYAWTVPGGDGEKQKLADVEWGWNLNHEDLMGINFIRRGMRNYEDVAHGTKVLGVIAARDNSKHCVGITPGLETVVTSGQWEYKDDFVSAEAVLCAISELDKGDVLLLEAQTKMYGKTNIPVEAEPAVFDLVKRATDLGIIVIAAAGNGAVDLDQVQDDEQQSVFDLNSPNSWQDSGAIIVGSAWPYINIDNDLEWYRLGNSCFGSRIDCFACGDAVVTLSSDYWGVNRDKWSKSFSATSAAAAIVAGAALSIQGILEKHAQPKLSPQEMRNLLSDTQFNTKSKNYPTDLIGVMPDLSEIIKRLL